MTNCGCATMYSIYLMHEKCILFTLNSKWMHAHNNFSSAQDLCRLCVRRLIDSINISHLSHGANVTIWSPVGILWRKQTATVKVLYGPYWKRKMLPVVLKLLQRILGILTILNPAWKQAVSNLNVIIFQLSLNKYCPNLVRICCTKFMT